MFVWTLKDAFIACVLLGCGFWFLYAAAADAIGPDFPATMLAMSGTCSTSVVKLLDAILGDGIASYFLYEAVGMKDGGKIYEVDGREWPIRSLDDVKAYVLREKTA